MVTIGRMTPMMRQYHEAKQACGDALLLFRMGDFYELFLDDAKIAAKLLGLTLTSRDKDSDNPTAMAGFPHHQLDTYLQKLIAAGYRAAVCEQVEDPKQAKGLVKREVTRVVSAGTLTDDGMLDPRTANYVAAVVRSGGKEDADAKIGIAWAELSSGRFETGVFPAAALMDELERIGPAEVLHRDDDLSTRSDAAVPWIWTARPAWSFALDAAKESLCKQFEVLNLEGFGLVCGDDDSGDEGRDEKSPRDELAIRAAGATLTYLNETQRTDLAHFRGIIAAGRSPHLQIDAATRRSLELTRTIRGGGRAGSLLDTVDMTQTPMGARLLADWIAAPSVSMSQITDRHDAVARFAIDAKLRDSIRDTLASMHDVSRLLSRVATGRCGPRDLQRIGVTLSHLPAMRASLDGRNESLITAAAEQLHFCATLRSRLEAALADHVPVAAADGDFIRDGFDDELDGLRELARGGKQWIAAYQQKQIESTGIANIKVGFNKVFGYYLEITNSHRDRVPDDYIRKQTLKNCERFITPELKEYEEKVLSADERASDREQALFAELRDLAAEHLQALSDISAALAELDVYSSLAEVAAGRGWVRPTMVDDSVLSISAGRHPVLDSTMPRGEFVANDATLSPEEGVIGLITGPNMAGKSTYIRQVALITLLAQAGSFVPAEEATIGLTDRIFARVGASDELSRGQSTFMVEMVETARILNTATSRSLVILDEIGRGTSTYDGLSLAWAITEYLHDQIGARTLFATHYHELTSLADTLPRIANYNVAVREWEGKVVFLHRIIRGGADRSYGIHVARLAGVPDAVTRRAGDVLAQLEGQDAAGGPSAEPNRTVCRSPDSPYQMTLFGFADHPLLEQLDDLDVNAMTPMQALEFLSEAKGTLKPRSD